MKSGVRRYILLSSICSLIVIILAGLIFLISDAAGGLSQKYPEYRYAECIDRSVSGQFFEKSGAQLYEAESGILSDVSIITENVLASGGKVVGDMSNKFEITFPITTAVNCRVKMSVHIAYIDGFWELVPADRVFSVKVNGRDILLNQAIIQPSFNQFHLQDADLCELDLKRGENQITITAESTGSALDYILLVPSTPRSTQEKTMGTYTWTFDEADSRQRLEVERAELNGGIPINSSSASAGYYIRNDGKADQSTMYIDSENACSTFISIAINNHGVSEYAQAVCEIVVNDNKLDISAVRFPLINDMNVFKEVLLGAIQLKKGQNKLEIISVNGNFSIDYFVLNANINFSQSRDMQHYEAENASLSGDYEIKFVKGASSNEVVVCKENTNTSVQFMLRSRAKGEHYLSVKMGYEGDKQSLDDVLTVRLNGIKLEISDCMLQKSIQETYSEYLIGKIFFQAGANTITLESKGEACEFDDIILTKKSLDRENLWLEAENAFWVDGCQEEWNNEASGRKNVGFNVEGSSVNFSFYSNVEKQAKLIICLSSIQTNNAYMNEYFSLIINGNVVNLYRVPLDLSGKWTVFLESQVGDFLVKKGINHITIISKGDTYNLDYIRIKG